MPALLIIVALVAGWEALVRAGAVDELILPAPSGVATALWEDRAILAPDLAVTAQEVLVGLAAAVALGAALGFAMHLSPAVRAALRPLVIGSQAVPVPVIAPLLILVLGFGLAPKVLLVALVCFFPVTINLYDGLRRVDPDARKLLRSFDASRWQAFRLLEAPAALPAAFTGLKVAAAVSVIGAVFAEWAGSDAALVHKPLTTLMSLKDIERPEDLAGKRVGTAGLPYQSAYLETILRAAGVDPATVKETNVGFNLVPAMLADKVDATPGAFWNYEGEDPKRRGRHPRILRMEKLG